MKWDSPQKYPLWIISKPISGMTLVMMTRFISLLGSGKRIRLLPKGVFSEMICPPQLLTYYPLTSAVCTTMASVCSLRPSKRITTLKTGSSQGCRRLTTWGYKAPILPRWAKTSTRTTRPPVKTTTSLTTGRGDTIRTTQICSDSIWARVLTSVLMTSRGLDLWIMSKIRRVAHSSSTSLGHNLPKTSTPK